MKVLCLIALLACVSPLLAAEASLYEQARELYKQGPAKGPEVVRMLREHIDSHPDDIEAVCLLGITLFGIEMPEEALPVIDRAIELSSEKKEIRPKMVMLRARTLYDLGRYGECKRMLEAYWAFWQDSPNLKKLYEWYYPRVQDAKEPEEAIQLPEPTAASGRGSS